MIFIYRINLILVLIPSAKRNFQILKLRIKGNLLWTFLDLNPRFNSPGQSPDSIDLKSESLLELKVIKNAIHYGIP